ncbi:MAG: nucleoside-diphosphate-sugar epimerase [Cryomorphaceae bacterium]|jgi:nucleoside-diphosphate-sugar epimerase
MKHHLLLIGPGYLGKEILREFKEAGWQVTTASRSSELALDISDLEQVKSLAEKLSSNETAATHVIHCASASAGRGASAEVRLKCYIDTYRKGCENLTEVFSDAHILFTSSTSVYGQKDGSLVTEESLTEPGSETAKVLLEAERAILEADGTIVRLSGIYGEGKSYLLKRLFSGEATMEGEGERILNHIHHRDGASACLFLLENNLRGIYNVSETTNLTLKQTYSSLCEKFSLAMPPSVSAAASLRSGLNKRVSTAKILELGWTPEFPTFLDAADSVAESLSLMKTS